MCVVVFYNFQRHQDRRTILTVGKMTLKTTMLIIILRSSREKNGIEVCHLDEDNISTSFISQIRIS